MDFFSSISFSAFFSLFISTRVLCSNFWIGNAPRWEVVVVIIIISL
jgi:hypothetical protein